MRQNSPISRATRLLALLSVAFLCVVLVGGCGSGRNDLPTEMTGIALYEDLNGNGILDAGDTLIVTFNQVLNPIGALATTDFNLPVAGDSLGVSPTFAIGPDTDQLTITLGTSPAFTVRKAFTSTRIVAGDASGIDIAVGITGGVLVGVEGENARPSTPVDIAPSFTDTGQTFASLTSRGLVTGDFDGDGDLDVFLVAFGEGNRVLLDSGGGVFVDSAQSLGSAPSLGAAVADFDNDGDLDVAVANDSGSTNRVWENDGSGTFTAGTTFGTGVSRGVAAADVDGDGRPDLVVANNGANTVWINQGTTFTDSAQSLGSSSSRAVAAADFDRDGDLDLVFANDNSSGRIWRNNGLGTFIAIEDLVGPGIGTSVAVGDIDRDGFVDVVIGSLDRGLTPFLNVGPTTFTADPDLGNGSVRAITLGDVDADGDLDLIEGRSGNFPDRVWFNDGIGFFDDSTMTLGAVSTYGVALGDLGLDGDLDLVTATLSGSARVYDNSLAAVGGAFSLVDSGQNLLNNVTPSLNVTLDAFLIDLDGDGDLDYLNGASPNGTARAWLNDGTGVFIQGSTFGAPGTAAISVTAGDLNGDSAADVLVGRTGQQTLIAQNIGGGLFTAIGSIPTSVGATQLRLGDLDGNGTRDLVTDNGAVTRVLLNNGAAVFTDTAQSIGAATPGGISLGNLDGDSDLDLVLGGAGGATRVYFNDGLGTFTDSGQALGTATTRDTALGDIDNDGDLDLVEAIDGGNRVWKNNGSGVFTDTLQSLGIDDTRRIALADLDGDGDLDVIEANDGSDSRVRLNDGTGVFIDSGLTLVTAGTALEVVTGDLDLDGDLDAVFGTSGGDRVYFRD